ncbi:GtrA family protein [Microbacterium sp. No. 7]|uniref:GtrA family protein n=1 Tax=Microbacterium sp. No. 7 TaxID=1714373 RepID=UPI0006CF50F8|nr:GtrA family protein [Microbacterium sp. No. 7]
MTLPPRIKRLAALGSRFLTVGALSTLIEIAVFNLLHYTMGVDLVSAKIIASLVALVNAYFGNRQWTFRDRARRRRWVELTLFLLVNAACTALGALLMWVGVELAQAILDRTVGPFVVNAVNIVSIVIVVFVRFVLYHKLVFRVSAAATT